MGLVRQLVAASLLQRRDTDAAKIDSDYLANLICGNRGVVGGSHSEESKKVQALGAMPRQHHMNNDLLI